MTQRRLVRKKVNPNSTAPYVLAGGSMLALVGLLTNPLDLLYPQLPPNTCEGTVQPQVVLSRDRLKQLLTQPERSPKATIQEIVQTPYCSLPTVEVRTGVTAQRDAYPLAFDPDTWFVVLYEGNEYAGYTFILQR